MGVFEFEVLLFASLVVIGLLFARVAYRLRTLRARMDAAEVDDEDVPTLTGWKRPWWKRW